MKKISTIVLGLSLMASSALYASGSGNHGHEDKTKTNNHKGDHMHEGKMQNHMNENGMTDAQMNNMNHGNTSMSNDSMKPYHHNMMIKGYNVTVSSKKPLTDGKNHMSIKLVKEGKAVKNAEVNIKFSMPAMPGMEFTEQANGHGNMYNAMVDFSMGGEWMYELMFKTSDGAMHKTKGSVNLK